MTAKALLERNSTKQNTMSFINRCLIVGFWSFTITLGINLFVPDVAKKLPIGTVLFAAGVASSIGLSLNKLAEKNE